MTVLYPGFSFGFSNWRPDERAHDEEGENSNGIQVSLNSNDTSNILRSNLSEAAASRKYHVGTIGIHLDELPRAVPDLCNESAWMQFAETAAKFPHLRTVELVRVQRHPPRQHPAQYPESLGITDNAFKSLIEAGKLACRFMESAQDFDRWRTLFTATLPTLRSKAWEGLEKKMTKSDGDSGVGSEEVVDDREANLGESPSPLQGAGRC